MLTLLVSGVIRQSLAGFSVELMIPDGRMVDVQASPSVRHIGPSPCVVSNQCVGLS